MLGWLRLELMAVSMMAIFSRRSLPDMAAGSSIVFTATKLPFQLAAGRCKPEQGSPGQSNNVSLLMTYHGHKPQLPVNKCLMVASHAQCRCCIPQIVQAN